jgi:hypothetical protein
MNIVIYNQIIHSLSGEFFSCFIYIPVHIFILFVFSFTFNTNFVDTFILWSGMAVLNYLVDSYVLQSLSDPSCVSISIKIQQN